MVPFSQRYAYVGNNPVAYRDPLGLTPVAPPPMMSTKEAIAPAWGFEDLRDGVLDLGGCLTRLKLRDCERLHDQVEAKTGQAIRMTSGGASLVVTRFATPSCLAFGLDVGGVVAIDVGGPFGVPVAAALFAGSLAVDASSGDLVGVGTSATLETAAPLQFAGEGAARTVAKRAGVLGLGLSGVACGMDAIAGR